MLGVTKFIEGIIAGLRAVKGNQCRLDAVYDELMTGLKGGLKEVTCGSRGRTSVVHQGIGEHEEGAASERVQVVAK